MPFEWMAPLMFVALVVVLLLGYPVAFSLGAVGLGFAFLGMQYGHLNLGLLQNIPLRIFDTMQNQLLLAVPFFTFMGLVLERSGLAEDLLDTIGQLFGSLRGGLAYAVILVGALLAATTGIVAASVIAMGLISLPIMLRYGYSARLATGVIAASGTLAQIIPPSLVLIVMADQLGVSVGDMYKAAFIPGFILTGLYVLYVLFTTLLRPQTAPALPPEARPHAGHERGAILGLLSYIILALVPWGLSLIGVHNTAYLDILLLILAVGISAYLYARNPLFARVLRVMIPPLVLIFLVLGTVFLGVATPTEGGAMGATGALLLAALRRRLTRDVLIQAMRETAKLTSFVVFILVGSRTFSLVFYGVDGDLWVEHLLSNLPGGQIGFLILINLFVFFLAFFLDYFEIAFIILPLLAPAVKAMDINLVYFGVLLGVNLQTSFMHPPFGFALFYLRSVAPSVVKTVDIYWGAVPFILIQLLMVGILLLFPGIVLRVLGG
ncbi:MAG: TRAP transporter large permease subunit [Thermus sp.]|uniref:TRAP transporter large permease subunit n=1 Tax=Thermus brevis TaxID=2862456 RepID=A0ABS7A360_9DEIN|nr:TRAP transporter large permease subunit [Thermus brevis]MBW6395780.1 TRAP transporter large permease subunit [Thermus brevis]